MTNSLTLSPAVAMEYEFSVNYKGQTLTLVRAERGAALADVVECARRAHFERFRRVCSEVRLAEKEDRPERWMLNPVISNLGEVWMLVVVWEFGYPDVQGVEVVR